MLNLVEISKAAFMEYMNLGTQIFTVLLALIYLLYSEKVNKFQHRVAWLGLTGFALLLIPGVVLLLQKLGIPELSGGYLMIPEALIIAYAGTIIVHKEHAIRGRVVTMVCMIFLLLVGVSIPWNFSMDNFSLVKNSSKIDSEVYEVANIIGNQYTLMPQDLAGQIQEFDSGTSILISDTEDVSMLSTLGTSYECAYLITNKDKVNEAVTGYDMYHEGEKYLIYSREVLDE